MATATHDHLIGAPPETVAKAIASPHGLGTWLADEARSEKKADGRLILFWQDGRQLVGRWTAYEPPARLGWRYRDDAGGPEMAVAFELTAEGDGTRVKVSEAGLPDADAEAAAARWRQTLEDLGTFVESGENGRLLRRPMLGIFPEEVTEEMAAKHGLPVQAGIRLAGLLDVGAAAKAGLAEGDVIVRIGEHEVKDWVTLSQALEAFEAGDTVQVTGYRDGGELAVDVTLQGRDRTEVPDDRDEIRKQISEFTAKTVRRFEELLAGVTDEEAEHHPEEGEWCVKEVIAHLSLAERWSQDWFARLASDDQPTGWPGGPESILQKALLATPIGALSERLAMDFRDSEAMCLAILDGDPPPWVVFQVASSTEFGGQHIEEHAAQIEKTLESARSE
jgi:uncharacterized protein YndB with AHSA1/START domain